MEAAQRNVYEIVRRDTEKMDDLVEDMNKINSALNKTHVVMQDFAILAIKYHGILGLQCVNHYGMHEGYLVRHVD